MVKIRRLHTKSRSSAKPKSTSSFIIIKQHIFFSFWCTKNKIENIATLKKKQSEHLHFYFIPTKTHLKRSPCCCFENFSDSLLALGGALEVGKGVDLLSHGPSLFGLDRLLLHLPQLLDGVWIVAKILITICSKTYHCKCIVLPFCFPRV